MRGDERAAPSQAWIAAGIDRLAPPLEEFIAAGTSSRGI
jgi:hypothetical protein